jgi:biotin operon repressor
MKSDLKFYQNLEFVITLLELLEKPVTVNCIANKCGMTSRSVYRWLVHLREMGFTIENHKGRFIILEGNNRMRILAYKLMNLCYPNSANKDVIILHQSKPLK